MLFFHTVEINEPILRDDPLFVGHFFDLHKMWWVNRRKRQQMILSIALTWYKLVKHQLKSPGMISEELILTGLTKEVREARSIIEHFFTITRIGFNLKDGVNKSPTLVTPKRLPQEYIDAIEKIADNIVFSPGLPPTSKTLVSSTVNIRHANAALVRTKLRELEREDLLPAVNWLFEQKEPVVFYYRPAGQLQARDTSVWPVKAIETWPSWLRADVFGASIDIENAFCQFMLQHLEKKHTSNRQILKLKYPDLLRAAYDRQNFREELCRDVLHLEVNDENIGTVKSLIMALANGSNASPKLMVGDGRLPKAVMIVKNAAPHLPATELLRIGERLQSIARQFRNAKRELCVILLKKKPSREGLKQIFVEYFKWEREARYKIWNATGQTGLMLHDGLDGIITDLSEIELVKLVHDETSLRISAEIPEEIT